MTDQPPPGGTYPPPPSSPGPAGEHEQGTGKHEAPPPGGGSYPPPPPPGGGSVPPPPGPAIRVLPKQDYTPWLSRVLAAVIDWLPYVVLHGIGLGIMLATQQTSCVTDITPYTVNQICATQNSVFGWLAHLVAWAVALFYLIWNYGYRQGVTGSSLGKSIMKFQVLSEITGQPIGFGKSVVRFLAHIVDVIICFIGFLFPLWDGKRQMLADKIMSTVCLPLSDAR